MVMSFKSIAVAVALCLTTFTAARADIVTNGGFETGNFNGWTVDTFSNDSAHAPVVIQYGQSSTYPTGAYGEVIPPPIGGGNYGAYFSTDYAVHAISQTLTLTIGQQYMLSFAVYAPANGLANPFDAQLNAYADNADPLVSIGSVKGLASGWNYFSAVFTATGLYNLEFDFAGGGNQAGDYAADLVLDNVSITAVPEPATWAMMILGFAFLTFAGLRERQRIAAGALA